MRAHEFIKESVDQNDNKVSDLKIKSLKDLDKSSVVSAAEFEKSKDIELPVVKKDDEEYDDDDMRGRFVGRNRQIAYMKPISKDKDINVSLGLGKPQMRNLHGKGQSAVLTIGGNPGDRKNFAGLQLSQPLSGNSGPGISAVYRKRF